MPSARSTSVAARASQRAAFALTNKQAIAAAIGTAIITERIGKPSIMLLRYRPGDRGGQAEQHHQRIGIDIARLQPRGDPAAAYHQRRQAVGAEPVDRPLIALLPEEAA